MSETTTCPAFWVGEGDDAECTEFDRHYCGLKADHAKCRCACGSTHKRPVDHVERFEEKTTAAPELPAVQAVRLLRVQPGDVVVSHVEHGLSAQEVDEFMVSVGDRLRERHPEVTFMAAEQLADVTIVRPGEAMERFAARLHEELGIDPDRVSPGETAAIIRKLPPEDHEGDSGGH